MLGSITVVGLPLGRGEVGHFRSRAKTKVKQVQLGVPHSRIQIELGFILQLAVLSILLKILGRAKVFKAQN